MSMGPRVVSLMSWGLVMLGYPGLALSSPRLYWTNYKYVYAKDLPDGSVRTVAEMTDETRPMWVRGYADRLYWTTYQGGAIWTSDLEGQGARIVVQQPWNAYTRNIEFLNGQMYWASEGLCAIYRADPNGQNIEQVVGGMSLNDSPVDFDFYQGRIYWVSWYGQMWSCTMDGQDVQRFYLPGDTGEVDAIEIADGIMYVGANALYAYRLSDFSPTVIATWEHITGMEIFGDHVYFNDEWDAKIFRSNLDGGNQVIVTESHSWQLTVIPEPATLSLVAVVGLAALRRR